MLYSAGITKRSVPSVSASSSISFIPSYMPSPFGQSAYRQGAGSWLKSPPNPFEQVAKSAASRIANFLSAAQKVQSSANDLLMKGSSSLYLSTDAIEIKVQPDEKKAVDQVKRLIFNYNAMHDRLKEAGDYMSPSVKRSLENTVNSSSYDQIGIQKNGDGTLKLDESKFKKSLSENYEQTSRALTASNGLAKSLEKETDRFNEMTASSLLNLQALQPYATYQSSMQSNMRFPATGLLINDIF
ncbi:flagellar filament capping protein FliD [Cohnella sp.]|uniref:flagellar filament capping protein FliD n=1 Tax=Cohnella sp. TaxID=1883426 RepID=UPI00356ADA1B